MIRVYCRSKHDSRKGLCSECRELEEYAHQRLEKCKFGEDKPNCDSCPIHCYKPQMRERVKEVMRYAGPRMLIYDPVLAIKHLFRKLKRVQKKSV